MLKKMFALSDKGAKSLKGGIIAAAFYNLCLMIPVGLLMKLVQDMLFFYREWRACNTEEYRVLSDWSGSVVCTDFCGTMGSV